MEKINMETWNRRNHFEVYSGIGSPFFHVSFVVNVKPLYQYVKTHRLPVYFATVHTVMKALNSVENFRYRIRNGEVWLLDEIQPKITAMDHDCGLYKLFCCHMEDDVADFCRKARDIADHQTEFYHDDGCLEDEVAKVSCLPWLELTSIGSGNNENPDDAVPHINWGKMVTRGDELILNITLVVNHRLIDGYHVGQLAQNLQKLIDEFADRES